ncbi:glutaminase A [Aminobacterium sp. MB27-C1]|uniref:glutaminase A n=1 Tax=Aminobacterium sp. MB27-C1 TaxID=3070661 RepID=UPI0027DCA004|nr:glutaminase A [Aminobacterium sp. MB27-C1]WMI70821.1 glutaminase A [Aminobacterium sp. MB27-C1]
MRERLTEIIDKCRPLYTQGKVARYIPDLAKADPKILGASVSNLEGDIFSAGDRDFRFSMQSVSKLLSLALALELLGEETVFSHVGMNPIADSFNSIVRLEIDYPHIPHNPLINAGAIVIVSILPYESAKECFEAILNLSREMTGNYNLKINEKTFLSEKATGDRNRSLAFFMKSVGTLKGNIEDILDVYFRECSIEATTEDLAIMGATIASGGINPKTKKHVLSDKTCKILRSLMATCGMYNASGEFAVRVGVPAKSGVSGVILATVPHRGGIAVVGPPLDSKGNSVTGIRVLEDIVNEFNLRIL